jgi:hypothetical protein
MPEVRPIKEASLNKNKEKASRQTHTHETRKLTKENSTGKTQMETCRV